MHGCGMMVGSLMSADNIYRLPVTVTAVTMHDVDNRPYTTTIRWFAGKLDRVQHAHEMGGYRLCSKEALFCFGPKLGPRRRCLVCKRWLARGVRRCVSNSPLFRAATRSG